MKTTEVEVGAGRVPEKQQGNTSITSPPGKSGMGLSKNIVSTVLIVPNEQGRANDTNLSSGHSTCFWGQHYRMVY